MQATFSICEGKYPGDTNTDSTVMGGLIRDEDISLKISIGSTPNDCIVDLLQVMSNRNRQTYRRTK
jgi:hypothetical protein